MLAQVARDIHRFELDLDAFKVLEGAFAYLLPSIPNTPEGAFADWMLLALKALESSHPAERFRLMLDGGTLALRLTYLDGKPLPLATRDRFADDFYEAYEVLTVLHDQHAARAALLMAFLRAARTLDR